MPDRPNLGAALRGRAAARPTSADPFPGAERSAEPAQAPHPTATVPAIPLARPVRYTKTTLSMEEGKHIRLKQLAAEQRTNLNTLFNEWADEYLRKHA